MNFSVKEIKESKKEIPSKLAVPSDLSEKGRQEVVSSINPLVADAFALYVKTKNYHWHLSGSHFRDYHILCDEQADQIFAIIDILAERVRKMGGTTIRSIGHINRLKNITDDDGSFLEADQMFQNLMEDNKNFVRRMREAHKICDEANDVATASFLEVFIDEAERRTWFLFEMISGHSNR